MFKGNKNGTLEDKRSLFEQVRVLIADNDARTADLVRRVLFSFGFRHILVADNGQDAIQIMRSRKIDLIITEWRLKVGDGIGFIETVRSNRDDPSIRRDVPIIMLTAQAELEDVARSRDAGVSEFLVKPFSAKTLSNRIIQVVDNPRVFVEAKDYVGPCRRRKAPAPSGVERRSPPKITMQKDAKGNSLFASITALVKIESQPQAEIYAPNASISHNIGGKAAEILTDKVIAEAQETLMAAEGDFLDWARDDIAKLESAYEEMRARPGDSVAHHLIMSTAYSIKAQAGMFGYQLGTEIGGLLVLYLQQNPMIDAQRLVVVRKCIDTIQVIFNQKMKHADPKIGQEMLQSLKTLIHKIG